MCINLYAIVHMKIKLIKKKLRSSPELKAVQVGLDSETGILFFSGFSRFSSPIVYMKNKTGTEK